MHCNCCNDCCPEVVPVTINDTDVTIEDNALDISLVVVDPNTQTVSIQVQDTDGNPVNDYFRIKFWLVDIATPTEERSLTTPDTPGVVEWERVTDVNGSVSFNISHTVLHTWYLCATLGIGIEISPAITVGS